ncbi:Pyruvate/Phosphoenolpyruvate kinase [Niveomyces insectorum RCEF 264]|uniref:Pyruvate/Phosphoenolpyruvate kinase n=1 Tax=Niveomyces insectorum RCEF 264 TaxID=1081102 RepID=A0A167SLG0_9HYPO|nr:Pyruvate/Phosphoenolpyruvate kinase [Niveomyces insectorum RCEF 264]
MTVHDTQASENAIEGPMSACARLRKMLAQPNKTVTAVGVYDGISARLALNEGFECLYMTGSGTAASVLGVPDLGITNLTDMATNAGMIAGLDPTVPVIADADTGFGESLAVARTVRAYMAGGVAALHIEDQPLNKRCGHLNSKELVSEDVYFKRLRAAAQTRDTLRAQTGQDIIIIARTDSMQALGYEAAVDRLRRSREAGAEVAFLEGITSMEQCERVCKDLEGMPVLLNMVSGGLTPDLSVAEANALGFKIVIFPSAVFSMVMEAAQTQLRHLKATGRQIVTEYRKKMGPRFFFNAMGLEECVEFDRKLGGQSYANGI